MRVGGVRRGALSGITAPQKTATIDVSFASGLLAIGTYTGKLCISTNASVTPTEVPLSLNVIYAFGSFLPPVASPPALNLQTGGQTVPVKFTLDALLADVIAPGFPASRQVDWLPANRSARSYRPLAWRASISTHRSICGTPTRVGATHVASSSFDSLMPPSTMRSLSSGADDPLRCHRATRCSRRA
jgi:hypothetical protein